MHRSFSYTLLITWLIFLISRKRDFDITNANTKNKAVSEDAAILDSQLAQQYNSYEKNREKDMNFAIPVSEIEIIKNKPEFEVTIIPANLLLPVGVIELPNMGLSF